MTNDNSRINWPTEEEIMAKADEYGSQGNTFYAGVQWLSSRLQPQTEPEANNDVREFTEAFTAGYNCAKQEHDALKTENQRYREALEDITEVYERTVNSAYCQVGEDEEALSKSKAVLEKYKQPKL